MASSARRTDLLSHATPLVRRLQQTATGRSVLGRIAPVRDRLLEFERIRLLLGVSRRKAMSKRLMTRLRPVWPAIIRLRTTRDRATRLTPVTGAYVTSLVIAVLAFTGGSGTAPADAQGGTPAPVAQAVK